MCGCFQQSYNSKPEKDTDDIAFKLAPSGFWWNYFIFVVVWILCYAVIKCKHWVECRPDSDFVIREFEC